MSKAQGSCRQCRRETEKLFLKGERCYTQKCAVERRKYPPGQHGMAKVRISEYGKRLREKQKARVIYGLSEHQFRSYFEKASGLEGVTGEKLLELLERRLDNAVFRLGYVQTRAAARQIVRHGHVSVNGKKVNIPSFQVKVNDVIAVKPKALEKAKEKLKDYDPPSWLAHDENYKGCIVRLPTKEDTEKIIQESAIVEYYSR